MNEKLFRLILLIFVNIEIVQAQDTLSYWIDYNNKEVVKENARFRRTVWKEGEVWRVNDYWPNGRLQMIAAYLTDSLIDLNGDYQSFFENGNPEIKASYRNNELIGEFQKWYENGNPSVYGLYASNYVRDIDLRNTSNAFSNNANKIIPDDSLSIKLGVWTYYHPNGKPSAIEEFDTIGNTMGVKYFDPNGDPSRDDAITNQLPIYPGGERALVRFLSKNVKYPKKEKKKGAEGLVRIVFEVDRQGYVTKVRIKDSASELFDAEALRAIHLMPRWTPGRFYNREVSVEYILPVLFSIR